jgi:hypothetical protein
MFDTVQTVSDVAAKLKLKGTLEYRNRIRIGTGDRDINFLIPRFLNYFVDVYLIDQDILGLMHHNLEVATDRLSRYAKRVVCTGKNTVQHMVYIISMLLVGDDMNHGSLVE